MRLKRKPIMLWSQLQSICCLRVRVAVLRMKKKLAQGMVQEEGKG
jgi:hypothetical protein